MLQLGYHFQACREGISRVLLWAGPSPTLPPEPTARACSQTNRQGICESARFHSVDNNTRCMHVAQRTGLHIQARMTLDPAETYL